MDPISAIASLISLGTIFGHFLQGTRSITNPIDEEDWKKLVRLAPSGNHYYTTWDITLAKGQAWKQLVESHDGGISQGPELYPVQEKNIIRFTLEESNDESAYLLNEAAIITNLKSSFTVLSRQWKESSPGSSYPIMTYETSIPAMVVRYIRVFEDENQKPHGTVTRPTAKISTNLS